MGITANVQGCRCADSLCYFSLGLLPTNDRKLMVYLPAGRQVPKLGYGRSVGSAADKRYVD